MIYYAKITKDKYGDYNVDFPKLQGCHTSGNTLNEAKSNAKEALDGWLASVCSRDLKIPNPTPRKSKIFFPIEVNSRVAFAITLRKTRSLNNLTQNMAAKRIGVTQQQYARLEDPDKTNPTLKTIEKIKEALGVHFNFSIAPKRLEAISYILKYVD